MTSHNTSRGIEHMTSHKQEVPSRVAVRGESGESGATSEGKLVGEPQIPRVMHHGSNNYPLWMSITCTYVPEFMVAYNTTWANYCKESGSVGKTNHCSNWNDRKVWELWARERWTKTNSLDGLSTNRCSVMQHRGVLKVLGWATNIEFEELSSKKNVYEQY